MENEKLILTCIGVDDWGRTVYKDKDGNLFKNVEPKHKEMCLFTVSGGFEGEPDTPIEYIEKYKNIIIETNDTKDLEIEDEDRREDRGFEYQLLSRLMQDCKYYLGNGNRSRKHLWANNEVEQIAKMKELYNSFKDDEKPQWISFEDILKYEKDMLSK